MLKNIRTLKGATELNKASQKDILGGRIKDLKRCSTQSDCRADQICQNGTCFNCYDPRTGNWFC